MDIKEVHEKQIKSICWPDSGHGSGQCLHSSDSVILEMSGTYHGDHDEFWIIESHKINGEFVEVARHNPRYVEGWQWA